MSPCILCFAKFSLFILVRQVFECCWLKESMAAKVIIPRIIAHFRHLKFLLHEELLYVYDEAEAVLDRSHDA